MIIIKKITFEEAYIVLFYIQIELYDLIKRAFLLDLTPFFIESKPLLKTN